MGGALTPFFNDRAQYLRLSPLSLPKLRAAGEPPAAYVTRMKALEVLALLHAAQKKHQAALDRALFGSTPSRWATR